MKHQFPLEPADANVVLSNEGVIPSEDVDPVGGSGPVRIRTSSGKRDPYIC